MCALLLCACSAGVDYYYEQNSDGSVSRRIEVRLSAQTLREVETGATEPLNDYLSDIAALFGMSLSTSYGADETRVFALYDKFMPDDSGSDEDSDVKYSFENGFFTRRITVTQGDPFNGLRAAYDGTEPIAPHSLMDVLCSGISAADVPGLPADIPALKEAFPAIASMDPGAIKTRFLWHNDSVEPVNGTTETIDGKRWSVWEGSFDSEYRSFVYSYTALNPVGFYVIVLIVGAVVAVTIFLVTRKDKREPKMVEADPAARRAARMRELAAERERERNRGREAYEARRELDELFSGEDKTDGERARTEKLLRETLPPDEAERAIARLREKKGK